MFAKFISYASWGFLALFAIPSVLAVGSWNSLPGDSMYDVKLTMEQALLLAMSPSAAAKGALHVKYTERRFSDAQKLIANKQSVQGLLYLEKEVASAKKSIEAAPKAERKQLARQYVTTLRTVSNQLEQEKQRVQNVSPTTTTTTTRTTANTANQGNTQSSGSSGSTPSGGGTTTVVNQIDDTQNQITDTIDDLGQLQFQTQMDAPVVPPAPSVGQQNENSQGDEHRNENATQNQEEKKNQDEQKKENTQKDTNSGNSEHKDN